MDIFEQGKTNAFSVILGGGSGSRMGNPDKPKQFLMLGSKPILVHTVEKFCSTSLFDAVIVLCPATWVQQTKDLLKKYCPELSRSVVVLAGGETRNDTLTNALAYINSHYDINDDSVVVTHDAVRPFVSYRIIEENLRVARSCGACDTVVAATDTIVESADGKVISSIPNRSSYYQGQTPQSFKVKKLAELMESLSLEEKEQLTDACKIYVLRNEKVALVMGDQLNIKITFPQDMRVAEVFLRGSDA